MLHNIRNWSSIIFASKLFKWRDGQLDGHIVDWLDNTTQLTRDLVLWISCLAVLITLNHFFKKSWVNIVSVISAMIIGMQLAAVIQLGVTASSNQGTVQLSKDEMFTLSQENNIIVFVLDTLDARYFEEYILNEPEYKEILKDFIYFDNAVSGGGPTIYGMPLLLTGTYYRGEGYDKYLENAFFSTNFYQKLQKNNYDVRLYTTDEFIADEFFITNIDNAKNAQLKIASKKGLLWKLYQLVGYKYLPNAVKNNFYLYSGEFDTFMVVEDEAGNLNDPYILNDAEFINNFRNNGIKVIDTEGAFRLYHLFGAHGPYSLDENGNNISEGTTLKQQLNGVMGMLKEYIQEMKELGIYENSTIVITGDHGAYDVYQNPAVAIKSRQKIGTEWRFLMPL